MRVHRSGTGHRWLVFVPPHYRPAARFFGNLGGYLAVIGIVGWMGHVGWNGLRALVDPAHPINRIEAPLTPDEAGAGRVRGTMRVPGEATAPPICLVIHEYYKHGKHSGWREDARAVITSDPRLTDAVGAPRAVAADAEIRFEPELPRLSKRQDDWRGRFAPEVSGGRFLEQCADPGAEVFVDGCTAPDGSIGGCANVPLTLTTGRKLPQPRLDALAAGFAWRLTALFAAILAVLLWAWLVVRARPLASKLAARTRLAPRRTKFDLPIWLPILFACGLAGVVLIRQSAADLGTPGKLDRSGYVLGSAVACLAVLLFTVGRRRAARLVAASRPVLESPTTLLRQAEGRHVELAVRVRADAPTIPGPVSGLPHAWWGLKIVESRRTGSRSWSTTVVHASAEPRGIPVNDDSGAGELDLDHTDADLRAVSRVVKPRTQVSARLESILREIPRRRGHEYFVVEERFVDPGEQLYVLGRVELETEGAAAMAAGYREAASGTPILRGTKEDKLLVYAGSERSLLQMLRRELIIVRALAWSMLGLGTVAAATIVYLASR